jgi:hypothetical protein
LLKPERLLFLFVAISTCKVEACWQSVSFDVAFTTTTHRHRATDCASSFSFFLNENFVNHLSVYRFMNWSNQNSGQKYRRLRLLSNNVEV